MEKIIKRFLFIALLSIVKPEIGEAQFLKSNELDFQTFSKFENSFREWRRTTDISKVNGWKWLARWEAENAKNLNSNGELADQKIYLQEAVRIESEKNKGQLHNSNNSWIPVGPYYRDNGFGEGEKMGRVNTIAFHPTKPNTIFIGVAQGGIWESSDDGETWIERNNGLPILRISDIAIDPNDPKVMYVCLGDYAYIGVSLRSADRKRNTHYGLGIYKSTDGGNSWLPTGLTVSQTGLDNSLFRRVYINPKNSQELVAAGVSGVFKSKDAGKTWSKKNDHLIWDIEMDHFNSNILIASSGYLQRLQQGKAGLLKSTNFGETWVEVKANIPERDTVERIEISSSPVDSNYVYAVASNVDFGFFGFYRSTDRGNTWTKILADSGNNNILGYNLGSPGGQASYDMGLIAHAENKNEVSVAGIGVFKSKNAGLSWEQTGYTCDGDESCLHSDQHYLAFNPKSKKYYVCNDGGVYMSDDLESFQFITFGLNITSFYRIGLGQNNPPSILAGAQDNGTTLIYEGPGKNVFGGDGMDCIVDYQDPNIWFVSYQYGRFFRTSLTGANSKSMNIGNPDAGEWTTPIIMSRNDSKKLLVGFGDVYLTADGGNSWNKISNFLPMLGLGSPAPASALAMSKSDENYIYVAKRIYHSFNQPSQLFVSKDGGDTWMDVTKGLPDSNYFTSITVSDSDPKLVYVSCAGFVGGSKIYKSVDAGQTWENISLNLPNIPMNWVIHQPNTKTNIVYVGSDLGVYYSNDSLKKWIRYSNNLPNVIVDELEIHEPSKKLYAATFGRGVWMTDLLDDNSVGLLEQDRLSEFSFDVFPNPNSGQFSLQLNNNLISEFLLEIVDLQGRIVYSTECKNAINKKIIPVNVNLRSGIYFAKISGTFDGMRVQKFQVGN